MSKGGRTFNGIYYAALNTSLNTHSEHIVPMIEVVRGFLTFIPQGFILQCGVERLQLLLKS